MLYTNPNPIIMKSILERYPVEHIELLRSRSEQRIKDNPDLDITKQFIELCSSILSNRK
jgi:hypothetical protein